MTTYNLTRAERETIARWDELDSMVDYYTASPKEIRKMDALVNDYPNTFKCVWEDDFCMAKKYRFPAKYLNVRKPASEARIEAARANARKLYEHRQKHSQLAQNTDLSHSSEELIDRQ